MIEKALAELLCDHEDVETAIGEDEDVKTAIDEDEDVKTAINDEDLKTAIDEDEELETAIDGDEIPHIGDLLDSENVFGSSLGRHNCEIRVQGEVFLVGLKIFCGIMEVLNSVIILIKR